MKHLKTYEKIIKYYLQESLDKFFECYNQFKINKHNKGYEDSIKYIKNYITDTFEEEFTLLYFYYGGIYDHKWSYIKYSNDSDVNNFIKKEIKKIALDSILKKFENNFDCYNELKEFLVQKEKRLSWGTKNTQIIKNIYFLFSKALRISPINNTIQKYNL